jgi:hypothetical protein
LLSGLFKLKDVPAAASKPIKRNGVWVIIPFVLSSYLIKSITLVPAGTAAVGLYIL